MIETNHFLHQHFNVPNNKEPSFILLMQIALNAGQLNPSMTTDKFGKEFIAMYKSSMTDINTYMHNDSYDLFDVSDEIVERLENEMSNAVNEMTNDRYDMKCGSNDMYYLKYKYENKLTKRNKYM